VPRYEYVCDHCGWREDQVRPISARDALEPCPACASGQRTSGTRFGLLKRDVVAGMRPHTDMGYNSPILSNSAGINPAQIPEAVQRFPHHKFTPDGRMIFESHTHRERCLRDIGLYDRN
jgi:putative FmdB family regulatory protein